MKVAIPRGNTHGWGVAGTYLAAELAKLPPLEGVTLHSVAGHHFEPTFPEEWDRINIGYCFFESEIVAYRFIPAAAKRWDYIVAGSSWCEHHLRIAGMDRTSTILQGIDPALFHPLPQRPDDGRFIVFSGGKFEFRKGHDLVIAAMRVFMQQHPDAWLACCWHNHWPMSIRTMEQSRHISFQYYDAPCDQLFRSLLAENGIPPERVILYPLLDNQAMRDAYCTSDIGLFPNRCEGGNNMVMCEYMACGRPVIASPMTGHMDVVSAQNAICLTACEPIVATHGDAPAGVWFEPSVDEIIGALNQAYSDRTALRQLGHAAGQSMTSLSWSAAAEKFHAIGRRLLEASAITIPPPSAERAAELFLSGRLQEAAREYTGLLSRTPLNPDLHNNLGTVLDRLGRYSESVLHYEKALALRPQFSEAHFNLANTLKRMGDQHGALHHLEAAVSVSPRFKEAWQNLALCRLDAHDTPGAVAALEQVVDIDPNDIKSRADLGELYSEAGRYQDAVGCFEMVLAIDPGHQAALNSQGIALHRLNDLDAAERCFRSVLSVDPDNSLALNNMGAIMRSRALPDEAIAYFDRSLAADPSDASVIFNRSMACLLKGDFAHGWPGFEYRFSRTNPVIHRHAALPRWHGEPLAGTRILTWCEQGYGDSIQFIRYARLLAEAGAEVVVEAQDERIAPLLARAAGVARVVTRNDTVSNIDFQIPLLSLPGILGNIPCPPRYLEADQESIARWRHLLDADTCLNIGLAWAGRPAHDDDRNRSIPQQLFEPLADCCNARFISLQFSPAQQMSRPALYDVSGSVQSFADSAALIASLDLVISVDSAVAHLAGALNVPVWILLPYNPDWRWLLGRSDTPWYASARLFRQQQPFQWNDVITSVAQEIQLLRKNIKEINLPSDM